MNAGRLTVGIIGAGPVGAVLGQALASAGHIVVGIASTDERNLERAAIMLPGVPIKSVLQIIEDADLVLFAIPADQLAPTINGLAQNSVWRAGQLVVHTAGEHGYNILGPATAQGVIPLAIHPAMTFTGTSIDLAKIRESYFAVAAPNVALPIAQALVIEMGAEPIVIAEADRQKYFEAVSVANEFSAMVVNQAIGLLEEIGIDDARGVIAPTIRSAVEQALAKGHQPLDPDELLG